MKYSIIIFVFLMSYFAYSNTYNIRVNQSKFNVSAINHYGNDLISANQVSNYILPKSKFIKNDNKIESNDFTIHFTPGTVYIVKENWLGRRVAQLDLPVLSMKKNIYFPLKSLLYSLDSLNIYNVLASEDQKNFLLADNSFAGLSALPKLESLSELQNQALNSLPRKGSNSQNAIIFSSGDGTNIRVSESEPFKKSFLDLNKKFKKSIELLKPDKFVPTEPKKEDLPSENNYVIPKDLIRKELEEIKRKKN